MRPVISAAVAAAALLGATGAAQAVSQIQFDMLEARFFDPTGGGSPTISPVGFGDPISIRWGTPASGSPGQSGYDFDAAETFTADVGSTFDLGAFDHINNPIFGSITGVKLEVRGDITIFPDGGGGPSVIGQRTFAFDILHDETPNTDDPCLFGGANDQGVNINGCADRVRIFENFGTTESFLIGDVEYTLDILGFFDAATNTFNQEFLSPEEGTNERVLRARFTEKANIIPLPAGALLIGSALLGAGAVRRLSTRRG